MNETTNTGKTNIKVLDWTNNDNISITSLEGCTVKVWIEYASNSSSLALATEPVTFRITPASQLYIRERSRIGT